MENISKKALLSYGLAISAFAPGVFVIHIFMGLIPEQNKIFLLLYGLGIIPGIFIGAVVIFFQSRKLNNIYSKINKSNKEKLKLLSEKTMSLPFFITTIVAFVIIISSLIGNLTFAYLEINIFNRISYFLLMFGALGVLLPVAFLSAEFFLKDINIKISLHTNELNVKTNPVRFSSTKKTLFSSVFMIIGFMVIIYMVSYYYFTFSSADLVKTGYRNFQNELIKNNPLFLQENLPVENLKKIASEINFDKNGTVALADKTGEIIYQTKNIDIWNNITEKKLKPDLQNSEQGEFYENIYGNILCYTPINKEYTLIFISNISQISKKNQSNFTVALLIIFLGAVFITISFFFSNSVTQYSFNYIIDLFISVSKGDFTKRAGKNAADEFGKIIDNYNIFADKIINLIHKVKENSSNVYSTSNQLSSMSQQISERASEQASTIEEVATSMEQMIASVNMNTENATSTIGTTQKSANEIEKSNKAFLEIINLISDKIKIVSSIADKTDILSINAAIEAARAGEKGKGFAVVANEIRKLADKTQITSNEVDKLSKSGKNISKTAGKRLTKLIPEILISAELLNNIIEAGKEQKIGIEAINISVQQLTEITNENSASAEEMSASAEELSAQAEQLKELISVFKIGNFENKQNDFNISKTTLQIKDNQQTNRQLTNRNRGHNLNLSKNDKPDSNYEKY